MQQTPLARESDRQVAGPAPHRTRRRAKLLLLLGSLVGAVLLAEAVVRIGVTVTHRVPLVVCNARTGWALPPNLRNEIKVGDGGRFATSTDAEGHRLTRLAGEPRNESRPTLIVVGDSFVQGQGVADSDSFAWILAHETGKNVVNLGILGFGTDQELISLADYLEAHPALDVRDIVAVVCDNDFGEVQVACHYLARTKPIFRLYNGRLETGRFQPSFGDHLMDVSYLYWLANSKYTLVFGKGFPDAAGGVDLVVACLSAMRDLAVRRGARFHVIAHHFLQKPEPFPESLWAQFLDRVGATDITPRLRAANRSDVIGYDGGHWSAGGHRLVAAIVKERLSAVSADRSSGSYKP